MKHSIRVWMKSEVSENSGTLVAKFPLSPPPGDVVPPQSWPDCGPAFNTQLPHSRHLAILLCVSLLFNTALPPSCCPTILHRPFIVFSLSLNSTFAANLLLFTAELFDGKRFDQRYKSFWSTGYYPLWPGGHIMCKTLSNSNGSEVTACNVFQKTNRKDGLWRCQVWAGTFFRHFRHVSQCQRVGAFKCKDYTCSLLFLRLFPQPTSHRSIQIQPRNEITLRFRLVTHQPHQLSLS